jgi:ATP-dependent Lon protease
MRRYDFTNTFGEYFALNKDFNTRDTIAVGRTFSGLAKLIYPNEIMTKEETRELLEYSIECRRRVKEQLRKMTPGEFSDVNLGYIDLDTAEEFIVTLPEVANGTLVFDGFETPGYVYGVGMSVNNLLGVYRLENKLVEGEGEFKFKNVEGISRSPKSVKDSLIAAFNYFGENSRKLISGSYEKFDYSLYFNDLQNRGVSDEISVAEVVGLFSGLANRPVMPSLVICGRVVMSGSMMPVVTELEEIFVAVSNAGGKTLMLPEESQADYDKLKDYLKKEIKVIFYSDPLDAAKKALLY